MEKDKLDAELVEAVQVESCSDSLSELIRRHTPLCYSVTQRYSYLFEPNGVRKDDVLDDKDFLIYKSALSYKPDKKTKFSTWLGNQVRYHCLNAINKNRLIATEEDQINKAINEKGESGLKIQRGEDVVYIKNLLSQAKDLRVLKIFEIRYFRPSDKKIPWSKVAKEVGISTQTAINLHNKTIKMLRIKFRSKDSLVMDKI